MIQNRPYVYRTRYGSKCRSCANGSLLYVSFTSSGAWFGFMRVYIESKELTVLEILLLFAVETGTYELQRTVVKVNASLHFIKDGVVE